MKMPNDPLTGALDLPPIAHSPMSKMMERELKEEKKKLFTSLMDEAKWQQQKLARPHDDDV